MEKMWRRTCRAWECRACREHGVRPHAFLKESLAKNFVRNFVSPPRPHERDCGTGPCAPAVSRYRLSVGADVLIGPPECIAKLNTKRIFRLRARSSSQSPLCSGHPSMGIRHGAPLLLLSPPAPLRWAPAGAPIFCADRKSPKNCLGEGEFRVPYPFRPFGTFPPDRGNRPLPLDTSSP